MKTGLFKFLLPSLMLGGSSLHALADDSKSKTTQQKNVLFLMTLGPNLIVTELTI